MPRHTPPVEDGIRYEFGERGAEQAQEAGEERLPSLPVFRARNLAERFTLMLSVLNTLGTGLPVERTRVRSQKRGVKEAALSNLQ